MYGNNGTNDNTQTGSVGSYGSDPNDNSTQPAKPNVDDLLPANFPNNDNSNSPVNDTSDQADLPDEGVQPDPVAQDPLSEPNNVAMGSDPVDASDGNSLLNIKQQALQQLSPLVDELQQTPEERFRTTMMMIQASDNKDLVQSAYDAAEQISDKKEKAQALLDVVNEINYFTQSGNTDQNSNQ